jgi:hypothetical protein
MTNVASTSSPIVTPQPPKVVESSEDEDEDEDDEDA